MPDVYEALANPVRRQLLDLLRDGPRPVVDVAGAFAMSRPAVSQHLRVLKEAGLVTDTSDGARRIYRLDPRGIAAMREWLDDHWASALAAFERFVDEQPEEDPS